MEVTVRHHLNAPALVVIIIIFIISICARAGLAGWPRP